MQNKLRVGIAGYGVVGRRRREVIDQNQNLKTVAVIMNKGEFKGASLHNMTNKPHGGGNIPQLYDEKKYAEIESYIEKEAEEFTNFCCSLYVKLPKLRDYLPPVN